MGISIKSNISIATVRPDEPFRYLMQLKYLCPSLMANSNPVA